MARTIEDYDSMARREMIKAKQEKAAAYGSSTFMWFGQSEYCRSVTASATGALQLTPPDGRRVCSGERISPLEGKQDRSDDVYLMLCNVM